VKVNHSRVLVVSLTVSAAVALKIILLFAEQTNLAVFMTSPLLMLALALIFARSADMVPDFFRQKV